MGILRRILGLDAADALVDNAKNGAASGLKSEPFRLAEWPPGLQVADPGVPLGAFTGAIIDVERIWRTQPNVRKVCDFIARNVASIPLHVYERVSDTDRQRITGHPLEATVNESAPYTSPYRFWSRLLLDGLLYDRWGVLKVPRADSDAMRLVRVPPWRLRFVVDGLDQVVNVEVLTDGVWKGYPPDALVWDFGYAPRGAGGVSPLETLADILDESAEAVRYRRQVWRNGARVPGWIERPLDAPEWDTTERGRFRAQFRASYSATGPEAGGIPLMEDGMKLHESAMFSPQDAQDLDGRRLTAIEVAAQYHIAPELVGAQQGNYSNVREFRQMLYRDSLGAYIAAWVGVINAQLTPDLAGGRPLYVEANIESKLRGSFEEQAQILSAAVGAPYMLRSEARARMNLPHIPAADDLVVPLNVLTGGQASPVDTGSQNTGLASAGPRVRVKATPATTDAEVDKYTTEITGFLEKQRRTIMSALGAKNTPPLADVWDTDEWNELLRPLIFARSERAAVLGAKEVVELIGLQGWDPAIMLAWLAAASTYLAQNFNRATYAHIAEAIKEPDWKEKVGDVFATAKSQRAAYLARTSTTDSSNFGRHEAAKHGGLSSKTWRVTSGNPRSTHAHLNGETVLLGAVFSNGARWPGDAVLPEKERANCRCEVEFSREDTSDAN